MTPASANGSPLPQLHAPPASACVDELESLRGLAALLALSQLTYWAVEQPLRQWSRRVAQARLA